MAEERGAADELLHLHVPDKHMELVRGMLMVREPPGFRHGRVTGDLASRLRASLERSGGTLVLVVEAEFMLTSDPDRVGQGAQTDTKWLSRRRARFALAALRLH